MFTRNFVLDGDKTTSGGTVHAKSNGMAFNDTNICFEGDAVLCPACNTTGFTKCVPPSRPYTGNDGRQANLDGDLCICGCATPPSLQGSCSFMQMEFESHEFVQMPGVEAWLENTNQKQFIYNQRFAVLNKQTGKPEANRHYRILYSRGILTGETDSDGLTETVSSDVAETIKIELLQGE